MTDVDAVTLAIDRVASAGSRQRDLGGHRSCADRANAIGSSTLAGHRQADDRARSTSATYSSPATCSIITTDRACGEDRRDVGQADARQVRERQEQQLEPGPRRIAGSMAAVNDPGQTTWTAVKA